MAIRTLRIAALSLILGLAAPLAAQAQQNTSIVEQQQAAWAKAQKVAKEGPVSVPLAGQVDFKLPAEFVFIPQPEAGELLRSFGNTPGSDMLGMVVPAGDENWIATIRFVKSGFIKDDDAKNWNVDELLESLRQGTEEDNKDRAARGFAEMEVKGWVEKPSYQADTHRLVWSALAMDKGGKEEDASVNYNTYVLGREGYVSLNFITTPGQIEAEKKLAQQLLASVSYVSGKAYADFNPSTDHVAEYGLAALVAGAAAKKFGLFAVIAAFFAKFAKVILVGVVALGGAVFNLFRRKTS
ncbi:DUF2167 domain-containing protein [Microvirga solisilvae]|uniref:DUF2167 domain-containing protein n=1 Tax=Microvirga solisilvae TaxID=2919498 RepID=UPI001FB00AFC|nr:DUF2167 domain-containing protein [Microvirga solisilvae]